MIYPRRTHKAEGAPRLAPHWSDAPMTVEVKWFLHPVLRQHHLGSWLFQVFIIIQNSLFEGSLYY